MASRAKTAPEVHFPWGEGGGRGSGVRDMALPSLGYLGDKFSEMSFPDFKTYFTQIGCCYHFYPIILHSQQHLVFWNWAENNHVFVYDFPVFRKVMSGSLGQGAFLAGRVSFKTSLPNGQGFQEVIL